MAEIVKYEITTSGPHDQHSVGPLLEYGFCPPPQSKWIKRYFMDQKIL